jgi:hypothetical protein
MKYSSFRPIPQTKKPDWGQIFCVLLRYFSNYYFLLSNAMLSEDILSSNLTLSLSKKPINSNLPFKAVWFLDSQN